MKKYRFKYTDKEIAKINEIFSGHDVTMEFNEIQHYLLALEMMAPVIHKSYDRYLKFIGRD